jgi:hypothetical protein
MKKRKTLLIALIALATLCCATTVTGYVIYSSQRRQAIEQHPLVLIHAPLNRDEVVVGQGTMLHVTARAQGGVSRLETWVDGKLIATRYASAGRAISPLVLVEMWEPSDTGVHTVIARAESASGASGQAVIVVEVIAEADEGETGAAPPTGGGGDGGDGGVGDTPVGDAPGGDGTGGDGGSSGDGSGGDSGDSGDGAGGDAGGGDGAGGDAGGGDGGGGDVGGGDDGDTGDSGDGAGGDSGEGSDGGSGDTGDSGDGSGDDDGDTDDTTDDDSGDKPMYGELPPWAHDPAPGSTSDVLQRWGLILRVPGAGEMQETSLHIELLGLETGAAYESVHCYIGLAENAPRWFPDTDGSQTTDESFDSTDGVTWNVDAYLSGANGPIVPWPAEEMLPIEMSCVGMTGGGTDAVELGQLALTVRPEAWDGITRRAVAASEEGSFTVDYRISRTGAQSVKALTTDYGMTSPTDVRLDPWHYSIRWEYYPRTDEEPIDGFGIYLNDTLQWTEEADARESGLPPEWFTPPCGDEYAFTVTAFRYEGAGGSESPQSEAVVTYTGDVGDAACQRSVLVTFHTLTTHQLAGDGERDPGDMGPIYGSFFANDRSVFFEGDCERGTVCSRVSLNHNSTYDISTMTSYCGDGPARMLVDISEMEPGDTPLSIGFDINDHDTGLRNTDDDVCSGIVRFEYDDLVGGGTSGTIISDQPPEYYGSCEVSYTVEQVFGDPVVAAGEEPPLPMLMVENITMNEAAGYPVIHIRNEGLGTWPDHTLEIDVFNTDGALLDQFSFADFYVEPGRTTTLALQGLEANPPLALCVELDPGNEMPEEEDRLAEGAWRRGRYCQTFPDLVVTDAGYDAENERMLIVVENIGDHDLEHRDVNITITTSDGIEFVAPGGWWADVSLGRRDSVVLEWPGIRDDLRARMAGGYTVTIDRGNHIAEKNEENNTHSERASARLWVTLTGTVGPCDAYPGDAEYRFAAYAVSIGGRRQIADWTIHEEHPCGGGGYLNEEYDTYWFDIAGDEDLEIVTQVEPRRDPLISSSEVYTAEEEWGSGSWGPTHTCTILAPDSPAKHSRLLGYYARGGEWRINYHICQEGYEED